MEALDKFITCYNLLKTASYILNDEDKRKALKHKYKFNGVLYEAGDIPFIRNQVDVPAGPEEHHPELNQLVHNNLVYDQSRVITEDPAIQYAASLHDLGKIKTDPNIWPKQHEHEALGVPLVDELSNQLSVPANFKQLALLVTKNHLKCHQAQNLSPKALKNLFEEFNGDRKLFIDFLTACKADAQGRLGKSEEPYPQYDFLLKEFDDYNNRPPPFVLEISGKDLYFLKPGKEMGDVLKLLKQFVLDGKLQNDKSILLEAAKKITNSR